MMMVRAGAESGGLAWSSGASKDSIRALYVMF